MDNRLPEEFKKQVCQLLDQSVTKIEHCLNQLDEDHVWWRPDIQMNSIGNLLLHITGNLTQWAVCTLTQQTDVRNRESEFKNANKLSKNQLESIVKNSVQSAKTAIIEMDDDLLLKSTIIQGFNVNVMEALLHTTSHFLGHTHQIIMITRLVLNEDYKFQWNPDSDSDALPM